MKGTNKVTKTPYTRGYARVRRKGELAPTQRLWGTYEDALAMRGCDGPGFALLAHENLCAIDLDFCFDETGALRIWAREIVDACETYVEYSPTPNKGLHVWGLVDDGIPSLGRHIKMGPATSTSKSISAAERSLSDRHRATLRSRPPARRHLGRSAPPAQPEGGAEPTSGNGAERSVGSDPGDPAELELGLGWVDFEVRS